LNDHPDGHPQRERELAGPGNAGVDGDHLASEAAGLDGAEPERVDRPPRLDASGADGLGCLLGDGAGEVLPALGEQGGRPVEDPRPLVRGQGLGQPSLGGRDRPVDMGGAARGHPTDLRTVVRRRHHDLVGGGHPFSADGDRRTLPHAF
jgi:hypothetical protein